MKCVNCGGETEVRDSRVKGSKGFVHRRRFCTVCGAKFSTRERPVQNDTSTDYEALMLFLETVPLRKIYALAVMLGYNTQEGE